MTYSNSKELMQQMSEKTGGVTLLAFSTGKDAIASWVELRKYFHTIIPVYYYLVPKLSFIERSLNYYEDFFQTKIIRLPNPNTYRMLNYGTYQTEATWKIIERFQFPMIKREQLCEYVKEDFGITKDAYVAIGNRAADNMMRQRAIYKRDKITGKISEIRAVNDKIKTFFPIFDYTIQDVVDSIKAAGVKLPMDYHVWGKTFDGLDYRFIKPIKEMWPDDYEKLKSYFPMLDLELIRYDKI